MADTKFCNSCRTEKPLDAFGLNNATKDKLQTICKKCRAEHRRISRAADRFGAIEKPLRERIEDSRREGDRIRALAAQSQRNSPGVEEALERYYARQSVV